MWNTTQIEASVLTGRLGNEQEANGTARPARCALLVERAAKIVTDTQVNCQRINACELTVLCLCWNYGDCYAPVDTLKGKVVNALPRVVIGQVVIAFRAFVVCGSGSQRSQRSGMCKSHRTIGACQ